MFEVVKSALNRRTSKVDVVLRKMAESRYAMLSVQADSADAFAELRNSFVHFCTSTQGKDIKTRDRIKLHQKAICALCEGIHINSKRGSMAFDRNGQIVSRPKTEMGSLFSASVLLSDDEIEQSLDWIRRLIVPPHITMTINALEVPARKPLVKIENCPLQTEIFDEQGVLKRVTMPALVEVYQPHPDEFPTLFEMGVPVAPASYSHHINVGQVIPMSYDRTSVPSAFIARLNSHVRPAVAAVLAQA
jgi:hypothetical protein